MTRSVRIVIPGPPIPWKAPYVGCRGAFSPRTAIMRDFKEIVKKQYSGPVLEGAVSCDVIAYMPIPKSVSKKKQAMMMNGELRPCKTPDRTNICKLYEDVIQGIVIENDSQIVDGVIEKWYSATPRVEIKVEEL